VVEQESPVNLRQARDAAEYKVMVLALARSDGNIARAAELLGVSRPTVYDLMNYHGVRS
jgi:two-component system NtrC family response regulator